MIRITYPKGSESDKKGIGIFFSNDPYPFNKAIRSADCRLRNTPQKDLGEAGELFGVGHTFIYLCQEFFDLDISLFEPFSTLRDQRNSFVGKCCKRIYIGGFGLYDADNLLQTLHSLGVIEGLAHNSK